MSVIVLLSVAFCAVKREKIYFFTELYKAASGENPSAIAPLISCGGLEFLKINKLPDFERVKRCRINPDLAFFAFCFDSTENIDELLSGLKVSNKLKKYCEILQGLALMPCPESRSDIKEMLNASSPEIFRDYAVFAGLYNLLTEAEDILIKKEPYCVKDLKVSGKELKKMGVTGTKIGECLEKMRKYVVENPQKNNEKDLTEYLISGILS